MFWSTWPSSSCGVETTVLILYYFLCSPMYTMVYPSVIGFVSVCYCKYVTMMQSKHTETSCHIRIHQYKHSAAQEIRPIEHSSSFTTRLLTPVVENFLKKV
jgi:hypothetical protein